MEGEKREIWRLTVENVSTTMKPDDKDREQNMYKDVSSSSSLLLQDQIFIICALHVSDDME